MVASSAEVSVRCASLSARIATSSGKSSFIAQRHPHFDAEFGEARLFVGLDGGSIAFVDVESRLRDVPRTAPSLQRADDLCVDAAAAVRRLDIHETEIGMNLML